MFWHVVMLLCFPSLILNLRTLIWSRSSWIILLTVCSATTTRRVPMVVWVNTDSIIIILSPFLWQIGFISNLKGDIFLFFITDCAQKQHRQQRKLASPAENERLTAAVAAASLCPISRCLRQEERWGKWWLLFEKCLKSATLSPSARLQANSVDKTVPLSLSHHLSLLWPGILSQKKERKTNLKIAHWPLWTCVSTLLTKPAKK